MTLIDSDPRHDHDHPGASRTGIGWLVGSPVRLVLLSVAVVFAIDAAGTDDGPGLCLFRRCTGGYCPGCGMSRAARHMTRGELGAAWHDHPWMVLLAIQAVVGGAVYGVKDRAALADRVYGVVRRVGARIEGRRVITVLGMVNVVLVVGIWIARLVDGSIPRFF